MAITITDRAAEEIKAIAAKSKIAGDAYLRMGVKGGGCSGFSYLLDLCDGPADGDEVFETGGIHIVCDPKSYLYLNGAEVDFKEELMGRGFIFNNPNAKGTCGCGASFNA